MAVKPDRMQLRLPAPGGATRKPSAKQARRRARTCRWPAQVASRLAAGAESTESGRRGSGHRARAHARALAACAPASREAAARPTEAAPQRTHTWRAAGLGGTPVNGGLVSLGSEEVGDEEDRGVDRLARILAPRGASIVMCALGGQCACGVDCAVVGLSCCLAWRLGEEGGTWAEIAPRDEAEIAPRTEGRLGRRRPRRCCPHEAGRTNQGSRRPRWATRRSCLARAARRHEKRVSWGTGGGVEAGCEWQAVT